MKAIQVNITGGPESLELVDIPTPRPGPGQALVRIAASGVNFIDIYFRTGLYTVVPSVQLVRSPAFFDFHSAAAAMLQGMTAHYLTHSTFPLKAGDTCLVHAAAGGAGGLTLQMAKSLGARVFGTVSTAEKAQIARDAGADEIILYTEREFDV